MILTLCINYFNFCIARTDLINKSLVFTIQSNINDLTSFINDNHEKYIELFL